MLTKVGVAAVATTARAAAGMQSPTAILISLSAFGASEVRRHGQLWFTQLSLEAGADGVEVRSELLLDAACELPLIAQAVRAAGKSVVYSSAENLWAADGTLNLRALESALTAAKTLGAPRLKMAIGGFVPASHSTILHLQDR